MRGADKPFKHVDIPLGAEEVVANDDVYTAYTAALAEIEEGRLDMGVWTRSFAKASGDQEKAETLYIDSRVKSIMDAAVLVDTPPPVAKRAVIKTTDDEEPEGTERAKLSEFISRNRYHIGFAVVILAVLGWWGYTEYDIRQTATADATKTPFEKTQKPPESDKGLKTPAPASAPKPIEHRKTHTPARQVDASQFKPVSPPKPLQTQDPQSFPVSLEQAVAAISGEIDGASNPRMLPTLAEMESRYPVLRTATGRVAAHRLKDQIDKKLAEFARLETQSRVQDGQATPQSGFSATVQADLNAIEARAIKNYPYLATPAGKVVMDRIIERRDELIQQGVYPSIALTQAVNAYAPGNAPTPVKERSREPPPNPLIDSGNHSGFPARCRWVTPQDWSCK